jgi:acyl-CoA thioesterase-1
MTHAKAEPGYPSIRSGQPTIRKVARSCRAARAFLWTCAVTVGVLALAPAASAQEIIVALGDSNTAGFGVSPLEAFPARLEALLRSRGQPVHVVNAGVLGDTFGGMLARIDLSVPPGTRLVIVQGGYNDLVNGVPPDASISNLNAILARLQARGIKTVLCGFFNKNWDTIGRRLSAAHRATFVPGSTCYDPRYVGLDGLHMTAVGHEVIAGRLSGVVQPAARQKGMQQVEYR